MSRPPGRWGLIGPARDEAVEAGLPTTRGAAYGAAFGEATETTLTGFLAREFDRQMNNLGRAVDPGFDPYISASEANARFGRNGLITFDQALPESRAAELSEIRAREAARAEAIERSPSTPVENFAFAIAGSVLDPAGIAASLLPGGVIAKAAPGVRAAALSSSRLSRAGAFAVEGAAAGAVVEAAIFPLATLREGRDYTFGDALLNVVVSAGFGAAGGALRRADAPRSGPTARDIEDARRELSSTASLLDDIQERMIDEPQNRSALLQRYREASSRAQELERYLRSTVKPPELVRNASREARGAAVVSAIAEAAEDAPVETPGRLLDLDAEARAQRLEGEGEGEAAPARIIRADTAITPAGRSVDVDYALVEADDLITSQTDAGMRDRRYPEALQPRDRSRADMMLQVDEIAKNLDPRRVGETFDAAGGAPIASRDGVVESGNGRAMAIRRAYAQDLDTAARYRQFLTERGYPVEGMRAPVLVRLRRPGLSGAEREAFAREANARGASAMSAAEQARADARSMDPALFAQFQGGAIDAAANRAFLSGFFDRVAARADRNALVNADGAPSGEGLRRAYDALVAYAYEDLDLIMRLTEGGDEGFKAIAGGLRDAAPEVAALRAAIKRGDVPAESDPAPHISGALAMARIGKNQAGGIQLALDNADAFAGEIRPEVVDFLRLFYKDGAFTRPRARSTLAKLIETMARVTRESAEPSLLGEPSYVQPRDAALQALDAFADAARRERRDPGQFEGAAAAIRAAGRDGVGGEGGGRGGSGDAGAPGERPVAADREAVGETSVEPSRLDLLDAELDDAAEAGLIDAEELALARESDPPADQPTINEALRAAAFCLRNGGER